MSTYNHTMGDMDVIFAGGGTTACVVAGRLAKANPDLKILLIEGGKSNFEDPTVRNPAVFLSHLVPESKTMLFYKSKASKYLNNREAIVPMAGILGGGSSVNFMMYTRAQAVDYNSWKTEGWSSEELFELANKVETYHPKDEGIDQSRHGHNGPIHVSDGGYQGKSQAEFLATVRSLGYEVKADLQDFESNNGFSRWKRYVSPDGKRQDAAHAYIHPLLQDGQHPNLHLLLDSKVIRVLFDKSTSPPRAVGVEYKHNSRAQPIISLSKAVRNTVKASKLVVVSSGALGTPQILERSGIGNPEILRKVGINVISDVAGVGENYQDHHLLLYPYRSSLAEEETLDGILSGRKDFMKAMGENDPILGWNSIDVAAKLRMTDAEAEALGPDFAADWARDFADQPSRPVMICGPVNTFLADQTLVGPGQYFTMVAFTAYPYSRGSIHVTSAAEDDDDDGLSTGYDFDAGLLSHASDVKAQLWAYKLSREIARRLPYYRGELPLGHPTFAAGSAAAATSGLPPANGAAVANYEYSPADDAVIEDWIRANANTTWHSLGTCAMRPRAAGGVVDARLNVYGTRALKVADLSMVPENVAANTANTAFVVGEKAALIIAEDLGVKV